MHVQPYSTQADALRTSRRWWLLKEHAKCVEVAAVRRHGAALVAKLRQCETPEHAERLRGNTIAVSRADFPPPAEGEYYWVDLIGAQVVNRSGMELGVVDRVLNSGAQDLLEVRSGDKLLLVPLVDRYIDGIDAKRRRIRVDWEPDW